LALAAWIAAPAPADENHQAVGFEETHHEMAELRAEVSTLRTELTELRGQLNNKASGSYEGGCGCGNSGCCGCGTCGGCEPCCHSRGFWAEAELLFFKYHRSDGTDEAAPGQDEDLAAGFDFEISPRITLGYVRGDGLGARIRYWYYDHDSSVSGLNRFGNPFAISVETYNIDVEVFDTIALNCNTDLEWALGLRWNEFEERFSSPAAFLQEFNDFSGWGGIGSVELRRCVGERGALFLRARHGILMDDAEYDTDGTPGNQFESQDVVHAVTELAIGYQYTVPTCAGGYYFLKAQAEWQNWANYDRLFFFNGSPDVGFGGFGFAGGIAR
jgi:hypothetical protein